MESVFRWFGSVGMKLKGEKGDTPEQGAKVSFCASASLRLGALFYGNALKDIAMNSRFAVVVLALGISGAALAGWGPAVDLGPPVSIGREEAPFIMPGDTILFFSSWQGGNGGMDLWVSYYRSGAWQDPVNLGSVINTPYQESGTAIYQPDSTTLENAELYFSSNRRNEVNERLYVSVYQSGQWGPAVDLGDSINSPSWADHNCPTIAPAGDTLIFSSGRPGGMGLTDLWYSPRVSGVWQSPVNLGVPVNSASYEYYPFWSRDKLRLYFASDRLGGYGMDDIWCSERQGGIWLSPVNLGSNINTAASDLGESTTPNGLRLYFSRRSGYIYRSDWEGVGAEENEVEHRPGNGGLKILSVGPMPFTGRVRILYGISHDMDINARVYSVSGQMVRELFCGRREAGIYEVVWDGKGREGGKVAGGCYFVDLSDGTSHHATKVVFAP